MAAPLTHIVLSEKIIDRFFPEEDRSLFILGTSFPDIRYLKVIDRTKTHYEGITLGEIQGSSFAKGLQFHSLVDLVREKYMVAQGVYSYIPQSPFITQALKIFEDQILYTMVKDWPTISNYFNQINREEIEFGINNKAIDRRHRLLQNYMKQTPQQESIHNFIIDLGLNHDVATEIAGIVDSMQNNTRVRTIIEDFYNTFETLL